MSSTGNTTRSFDASLEVDAFAWPTATLDPVSRMRVLAAGLPYCAVRETVLRAAFERVWTFLSDLESNTERYESTVTEVRVLSRAADGPNERLQVASRSLPGVWMKLDVLMQPGFCVMHSPLGQIGFAAHPESETATRLIHFEGSPLLGRLVRPFYHWNVGRDFARLAELLE